MGVVTRTAPKVPPENDDSAGYLRDIFDIAALEQQPAEDAARTRPQGRRWN